MTTSTPHPEAIPQRTPRPAALASFMGSAVVYYDFFLFGSATALIFGEIGFLMAGFAPSIVTSFGVVREGGWTVISICTAVICLIVAGAAPFARETTDVPTELLGRQSQHPAKELVHQ